MQKTSKKIISAFLTIAMILGLFWAMPMTASAAITPAPPIIIQQPSYPAGGVMEGDTVTLTYMNFIDGMIIADGVPDEGKWWGIWEIKRNYGAYAGQWLVFRYDGQTAFRSPTLTFTAQKDLDIVELRYRVTINNGGKMYFSNEVHFVVYAAPPKITQQPQNTTVKEGESATLKVNATASGNLRYLWIKVSYSGSSTFETIYDGVDYSGTTTNTLTIKNVGNDYYGTYYYCVIYNSWSTDYDGGYTAYRTNKIESSYAKVMAQTPLPPPPPTAAPPNIVDQPEDRSITAGQNTTFAITIDGTGALQWQYRYPTGNTYSDWTNITNGGIYSMQIEQAWTLNLYNVPASYNNYQYRCVVTNAAGSATSNIVTLTVTEIHIISMPHDFIGIATIDLQPEDSQIMAGESTSFHIDAFGAGYQWQCRPYNGILGDLTWMDIPDTNVYSGAMTDTLTLINVPISYNNYQYRCVVQGFSAGNATSNIVKLTVTAAPPTESETEPTTEPPTESATSPTESPTEPTTPPLPFPMTDVVSTDWFYNNVKTAWEMGLVNGKTPTTYEPTANLTYAEAVKLAACMHQYYKEGNVTLVIGTTNWYDTYVEYAKDNGIISKDYDWNTYATRAGYMEIFANALPDEALGSQNNVANGSIPDVPMSHPQAAAIYKLYRAGIVQGVDNVTHACNPGSNIQRSEVAAIIDRMMNPTSRVTFTLG